MSKMDGMTREFLQDQISIEKQRLQACQENLNVHKQILQSLMTGDTRALSLSLENVERLTLLLGKTLNIYPSNGSLALFLTPSFPS